MKQEVSWTLPFLRRDSHHDGLQIRRLAINSRRLCGSGAADVFGLLFNECAAATNALPRVSTCAVLLALMVLTAVFAPDTVAEERVRLKCRPRTFRVVPGEPIRLELTVRAHSAAPIRVHVPGDPLLKLRAFEKLPVRRTPEGVIVHKRVVIWQALEPGLVKIDKLSVGTKGRTLRFPEVDISVRDPSP